MLLLISTGKLEMQAKEQFTPYNVFCYYHELSLFIAIPPLFDVTFKQINPLIFGFVFMLLYHGFQK